MIPNSFMFGVIAFLSIGIIAGIDNKRREHGAKSAFKFALCGFLPVWFGLAAMGIKWAWDYFTL